MALTKKDIDLLSEHFVTKSEFNFRLDELEERLDEKIKFLPTKDEFYVSMDKLMGKMEKIEQELTLTPSHSDLADLEKRIMPLEEIHPGGKHLTLQP
ncbi:hypothetical protein HYU89_00560 [Candidatus Collierbacteria bacterium]|nr:hypothetical protein [Candidatus Collierbacteria bacterium]